MPENRRQSTRHDVTIHAAFAVGEDALDTSIINLSLGGAQLEATTRYTMGQRGELSFNLPTSDEPIAVGVTVRWSDGKYVGVQFDGLRAREVWAINELFKQLQR